MILFSIALTTALVISGLGLAVDKNTITPDQYIDHLITISSALLAAAGVYATLKTNKDNLEKSLNKSEARHEQSLIQAREQFLAQMDKIEERNRIEDFHRYIEEIIKSGENIPSVMPDENRRVRPNSAAAIATHYVKSRAGIPKLNVEAVEFIIKTLRQSVDIMTTISDKIEDPNKSLDILHLLDALHKCLTAACPVLTNIKEITHSETLIIELDGDELEFEVLTTSLVDQSKVIDFSISFLTRIIHTAKIYGAVEEPVSRNLLDKIPMSKHIFSRTLDLSHQELKDKLGIVPINKG
jgi:hypothetical protein